MKRFSKFLAALLIVAMCLSSIAALAAGKVKTTGNVNLRKGAGLGYKIIRSISKNVTLSYDNTKKDGRGVKWYHVTYKGKTGWVSSKYAKETSSSSSSSSGNKVKTTGNVNFRSGPGLDYKSMSVIKSGTKLTYDETKKDGRGVLWYHVSYGGKTGWVSSKYAKKY